MQHARTIALIATALLAACGTPEPPVPRPVKEVVADTAAAPVTEGRQVLYTRDGGRVEGELRGGRRVGPWASYFANGSVRSRITYVDGVEEGPTEVFHENGMPYYTGTYHQGRSVGDWIFFDPQGREVRRVKYDSLGVVVR